MRTARRLVVTASVAALAVSLLPGIAASAEPQVTGTVTDADGDPVAGACVDFHDTIQTFARVTTAADGTYSTDPGTGTYRVRFHACDSGADVAATWYEAGRGYGDATPVSIDSSAANPVVLDMQLADGATVTGVARTAPNGEAVSGACITVTDPDDPSVRASGVAAANGAFSVGGLPAGTYVLKASDCGSSPAERATAFWGPDGAVARGPDDAAPVVLTEGGTTGIGAVVLPQAGTIGGFIGRFVNNSFEGVADACVTAIDLDSNTTLGTTTSGNGSYTISGVLPGNWLIRVSDCLQDDPEAKFATVYLLPDGGTTADAALAEANPFVVEAGGTVPGSSRSVELGGAVSGVVSEAMDPDALRTSAAAGDPVAGACIAVVPAGSLRIAESAVTAGDGSYTIGGLSTTQSYRIAAFDCGAVDRFGLQWSLDSLTPGQALPITVAAGDTVTGRNIQVGGVLRRAAGDNRVLTSVDLALGTFPAADTVVLARADEYPDALAGAPLASSLDAPIILTTSDELHPTVAATINALGATTVVLLGGEAALNATVEAQARSLPAVNGTDRIRGVNRFDTAARIAARLPSDHAYVVEGINASDARGWPDAVSVAGLAALQQRPLLLVSRDDVPASTEAGLGTLPIESLTIVGGPAAVSEDVEADLAGLGFSVDRVFGADRYETSTEVVDLSLASGAWSRTGWIATGRNYPDALVAGAVVGQDGGFLQLVPGDDLARSDAAVETLGELAEGIDRLILLGGEAAISAATQAQLATHLGLGD